MVGCLGSSIHFSEFVLKVIDFVVPSRESVSSPLEAFHQWKAWAEPKVGWVMVIRNGMNLSDTVIICINRYIDMYR